MKYYSFAVFCRTPRYFEEYIRGILKDILPCLTMYQGSYCKIRTSKFEIIFKRVWNSDSIHAYTNVIWLDDIREKIIEIIKENKDE